MDIDIEIANTTRKAVNADLIKKTAKRVVEGEIGQDCDSDIEISVAFVTPQKIKALNAKWRNIDRATDVLSFSENDFLKRLAKKSLRPDEFLGEIVICPDQVGKDAKELKVRLSHELAWVIVHGILHLFGYDHQAGKNDALLMRKKEEYYLSKI